MDKPRTRTIIHFDLDCFYAQVHMVENPSLRDKPLGVQQKTILATTNYVARAHGVPKMARITDALKICPSLVIVNGEVLTPYRRVSAAIFKFLQQLFSACPVQRLGLDEFFVDVSRVVEKIDREAQWIMQTGTQSICITNADKWKGPILDGNNGVGKRVKLDQEGHVASLRVGSVLAYHARALLEQELGYTCSVGVGDNKLLAKMGGEMHKPNNQTTVLPDGVAVLLQTRGLKRIPGLGRAMRRLLTGHDITTIDQVLALSLVQLKEIFDEKQAVLIFKMVRGRCDDPVVMTGRARSMTNEDNIGLTSELARVVPRLDALLKLLLARIVCQAPWCKTLSYQLPCLQDEDYAMYQRLPRTLRLSVCGPKYHQRTSKQEPIAKRLLTMDDPTRHQQIFDLCLALFHKLKPAPFQVSVINVGVTNFDDDGGAAAQGCQDISAFMQASSPQSKGSHSTVQVDAEDDPDGMFECDVCGAVLPQFCRDPHKLYHS
eukprot:m.232144 g.232144  ORF g.232144 m.232144 type:complete len:489 (+) comp17372_c0_seq15:60-1526(+)